MSISGIKSEKMVGGEMVPTLDEFTERYVFDYLVKYRSNYTMAEIEKAFYFNSIGKFPERVEHFQAFDTNFVSQVMDHWLMLKTKTRQRISALLPPPKEEIPTTPDQYYTGLIDYYKKNNQFPDHWAYGKVYDHMKSLGMIKLDDGERWDLYYAELEKLERQMEMDRMSGKIKTVEDIAARREGLKDHATANCMKNLVKQFLPV